MARIHASAASLLYAVALVCTPSDGQVISLPDSLIDNAATMSAVKTGLAMTEGPAFDSEGTLFFSVPYQDTIWHMPDGGSAAVFSGASNGANGLVFDVQDRMIACERHQLTRVESDSTIDTLVTLLGWANDLTLASDGGIYFTQPLWSGADSSFVFYLSPEGALDTLLARTPGFPNGIEYVEEADLLYVAYSQRNVVMAYTLNAQNALVDSTQFASVSTPDGFAIDEYGNLWVTSNSRARIHVYTPAGVELGTIQVSGQSSIQNCAFGGPDNSLLCIAGGNAVYTLQTRVSGRSTRGDAVSSVEKKRPAVTHTRPSAGHTSTVVLPRSTENAVLPAVSADLLGRTAPDAAAGATAPGCVIIETGSER